MQSLSLNSSLQSPTMALVLIRPEAPAESTSSKALQDVIAQLAQDLTQNGQLDQSSPLGKMLAKVMEAMGTTGGGLEDIKAALDKLIHEKLGDNFGASADTFGAGNSSGAGQSDLMTQVLNGLAKSALDELLFQQGNGTSFSKDDMPMLEKIAQFMDDNPAAFPAPDSGSWTKELTEDNFLDANETAQFRSALDVIGQQLATQPNETSGGSGLGGSSISPENQDVDPASYFTPDPQKTENTSLGQLVGEMVDRGLESMLSGGGLGTPSPAAQPANSTSGNTSGVDLGQLLGGLFEKGLEASLAGSVTANVGGDMKKGAELIAAAIVETLLQSRQSQAVA